MRLIFLPVWCLLCAEPFPLCAGGPPRPHTARRKLSAPQEVQGFPCDKGYAWFYDSGRLSSCFLSRDFQFGEAQAPRRSWIYFTPEGAPDFVFLSRTTLIRGLPCRGRGHQYMTTFYPSGQLKLCWLAADRDIAGVPCARATFFADVFGGGAGTHFHANGALSLCRLARDCTLQDQRFRKGDHPEFDPSGRLVPAR